VLAVTRVLDLVQEYFNRGVLTQSMAHGLHATGLAPLFLQYAGHSMTVVRIARHEPSSGETVQSRSLIVLDPAKKPTSKMRDFLEQRLWLADGNPVRVRDADALITPYLMEEWKLAKHDLFELITLTV